MVGDIRLDDRICSCRIFNGPRTVCPKTNSEELNPREAWVVFRTANNKSGICSSHSFSCSTQKVLSIDFNVWWNHSIAPCDWGWYALDTWCLKANCFITFANTLDIKLVPWSDWMCFGIPNVVQNLTTALTIVQALIERNGIASGNLVDAHN